MEIRFKSIKNEVVNKKPLSIVKTNNNVKFRHPICVVKGFASPLECDQVLEEIYANNNLERGVHDFGNFDTGPILKKNTYAMGLFNRLSKTLAHLNEDNYGIPDLCLFKTEKPAIARYGLQGFRGWHVDGGYMDSRLVEEFPGDKHFFKRRLTAVLQLSCPTTYSGGRLAFMKYQDPSYDTMGKGTLIVFPSFFWHQVEKVYSGTRTSMTVFAYQGGKDKKQKF